MYGEKIEESEELRLDLVDVKEMYKAQVILLFSYFSYQAQSFSYNVNLNFFYR